MVEWKETMQVTDLTEANYNKLMDETCSILEDIGKEIEDWLPDQLVKPKQPWWNEECANIKREWTTFSNFPTSLS